MSWVNWNIRINLKVHILFYLFFKPISSKIWNFCCFLVCYALRSVNTHNFQVQFRSLLASLGPHRGQINRGKGKLAKTHCKNALQKCTAKTHFKNAPWNRRVNEPLDREITILERVWFNSFHFSKCWKKLLKELWIRKHSPTAPHSHIHTHTHTHTYNTYIHTYVCVWERDWHSSECYFAEYL
jgi:hypothetical protein